MLLLCFISFYDLDFVYWKLVLFLLQRNSFEKKGLGSVSIANRIQRLDSYSFVVSNQFNDISQISIEHCSYFNVIRPMLGIWSR